MKLTRGVDAINGEQISSINGIHSYEIDRNNQVIGIHEDLWGTFVGPISGSVGARHETVSCRDWRWMSAPPVDAVMYVGEWLQSLEYVTETRYNSCPNVVQPSDKVRVLTLDTRAEKRFPAVWPNF